MGALIDFFVGLGETIGSIIGFVVDLFADLLYVIGLLGKFVIEIPSYFLWLPEEHVFLLVSIFGIVVIYMVLNRK